MAHTVQGGGTTPHIESSRRVVVRDRVVHSRALVQQHAVRA